MDGVADIYDNCPFTPASDVVDSQGCGLSQKDSDNDGVSDSNDDCPGTPGYDVVTVDLVGCGATQRDADGDGVSDSNDQCLNTPLGAAVRFFLHFLFILGLYNKLFCIIFNILS